MEGVHFKTDGGSTPDRVFVLVKSMSSCMFMTCSVFDVPIPQLMMRLLAMAGTGTVGLLLGPC
jgi:hypothetical protein